MFMLCCVCVNCIKKYNCEFCKKTSYKKRLKEK